MIKYDQFYKPTVNVYCNGITFFDVEEIRVEEDGFRVFNPNIEIGYINKKHEKDIIIL